MMMVAGGNCNIPLEFASQVARGGPEAEAGNVESGFLSAGHFEMECCAFCD